MGFNAWFGPAPGLSASDAVHRAFQAAGLARVAPESGAGGGEAYARQGLVGALLVGVEEAPPWANLMIYPITGEMRQGFGNDGLLSSFLCLTSLFHAAASASSRDSKSALS